jgi:hypothetical protein
MRHNRGSFVIARVLVTNDTDKQAIAQPNDLKRAFSQYDTDHTLSQ